MARHRAVALLTVPVAVAAAIALASCSKGGSGSDSAASAVVNTWKAPAVDPAKVPLGDGHRSTTEAMVGRVFACAAGGGGGGGGVGGAGVDGPWIHGDTWDSTAKAVVQGAVAWPQASYSMTIRGATRTIVTNDLPAHEKTGLFPIASTDPASAYDRNPNRIAEHPTTITLPVTPAAASAPTCVGGGPIGVLTNGVFVFDALDGPGRDAAAHETQDLCGGHPAPGNEYHYHDVSTCIRAAATGPSTVVGWAFDGYPIVVERDAAGSLPTNTDLDECHGRTSPVRVDGRVVTTYHYSATLEYPYSIGCFRGRNAVTTR
ncbi:MAG: hypothetical protein JWO37_2323 [Acidimicrobiales bacterium]|nr:hypothetical protein [Acidimicrobiales bacterium]